MISELAIIDPNAKIGKNVSIGPFTLIGANVEIGDGCKISSHVVIKGPTKMGKNNQIFQFASIGEDCQDLKYNGEETTLVIGDNNVFREYASIHRGTAQDKGMTSIGNHNHFMINSHVAHDCIVGNHVIFSNNSALAGHVQVDDYAILSGFVGVHQFVKIGAYSFISGGTMVVKDVAPYVIVSGHGDAQTHGLNTVGLTRREFSTEVIAGLKQAYKIIFRESATVNDAAEKLSTLADIYPEVVLIRDFILNSSRGITR